MAGSFIPGRGKSLSDCLKEYYDAQGEPVPPLHVTTQQHLADIIRSGAWQPPAGGGASFSFSGTLRAGDVALRIKPGSERYVELVPSSSAFGLVPRFWPNGVGSGDYKSYIPIQHLQFFNPLIKPLGAWRDL